MSYALPFKTDTVWPSGDAGAVPSGILGKTYFDPANGNLLQVVKNTDGSVISGCELVRWENALQLEVEKTAASGGVTGAGIVHPDYANRGVTIPINAAFFIVKSGKTVCLAGAVVGVGDRIISDGTDGRIQSDGTGQSAETYGVTYESGNAGDSVVCFVNFP